MTTREKLHQLIDELAEDKLPAALTFLEELQAGQPTGPVPYASLSFEPPDLAAILARQGVKPITSIEDLKGDFWPEEESVDEFIATVRRWRQEGGMGRILE